MGGRLQGPGLVPLYHLGDGRNVRRRGPAAPSHDIQPAVLREFFKLRRQGFRRLPELAVGIWQTGIRIA